MCWEGVDLRRIKRMSLLLALFLVFQSLTQGLVAVGSLDENLVYGNDAAVSVTDAVYGGHEVPAEPAGEAPEPEPSVTDDVYREPDPLNLFMNSLFSLDSDPFVPLDNVCDTAGGPLSVCLSAGYASGDIALGQSRAVNITMKNNGGLPDAYAFNIGIELILEDGLEVVGQNPYRVEVDSSGTQSVYWRDIKNLQADESFTFPVTITSSEHYRVKGEDEFGNPVVIPVEFGELIHFTVNVYYSEDARVVVGPPAEASVSVGSEFRTVPFLIDPSDAVKQVKGAGEDASGTNEWGEFSAHFRVINNTRHTTRFNHMTGSTDGSVQIYGLSSANGDPFVHRDYGLNLREFGWNDVE